MVQYTAIWTQFPGHVKVFWHPTCRLKPRDKAHHDKDIEIICSQHKELQSSRCWSFTDCNWPGSMHAVSNSATVSLACACVVDAMQLLIQSNQTLTKQIKHTSTQATGSAVFQRIPYRKTVVPECSCLLVPSTFRFLTDNHSITLTWLQWLGSPSGANEKRSSFWAC